MSRTCHSVIYTFVPAGGRDRSPFSPFYVSLKPVRSYRVPIRKERGGESFSLNEIEEKRREEKKERKKKEKAAMCTLRG